MNFIASVLALLITLSIYPVGAEANLPKTKASFLCSLAAGFGPRSLAYEKDKKQMKAILDQYKKINSTPRTNASSRTINKSSLSKEAGKNAELGPVLQELYNSMGVLYKTLTDFSVAEAISHYSLIKQAIKLTNSEMKEARVRNSSKLTDYTKLNQKLIKYSQDAISNIKAQTDSFIDPEMRLPEDKFKVVIDLMLERESNITNRIKQEFKPGSNPIVVFNLINKIRTNIGYLKENLQEKALAHRIDPEIDLYIFEAQREILENMAKREQSLYRMSLAKEDFFDFLEVLFTDKNQILHDRYFSKDEANALAAKIVLGLLKNPKMTEISQEDQFENYVAKIDEAVYQRIKEMVRKEEEKY